MQTNRSQSHEHTQREYLVLSALYALFRPWAVFYSDLIRSSFPGTISSVVSKFAMSANMERSVRQFRFNRMCDWSCPGWGAFRHLWTQKRSDHCRDTVHRLSGGVVESPTTASFLIIARWIGGVGVGIASMVSPLYISEVSPPHLRGRMAYIVSVRHYHWHIGMALFSNAGIQHLAESNGENTGQGLWNWMVIQEFWAWYVRIGTDPCSDVLGLMYAHP